MIKPIEIICDDCGEQAEIVKDISNAQRAHFTLELSNYRGNYKRFELCKKCFIKFTTIFNVKLL